MFSLENCAYNRRGNSSTLNQAAPYASFRKKIVFLHCMPSLEQSSFSCQMARGEPDVKNFVAKLKVLNLGQVECRCKLVLVDCLVVKKMLDSKCFQHFLCIYLRSSRQAGKADYTCRDLDYSKIISQKSVQL